MARVQYSHPQRNINVTKDMAPPVSISNVDAWFARARKTIPEIPVNWYRSTQAITEKTIIFELICRKTSERCAVVIARRDQ